MWSWKRVWQRKLQATSVIKEGLEQTCQSWMKGKDSPVQDIVKRRDISKMIQALETLPTLSTLMKEMQVEGRLGQEPYIEAYGTWTDAFRKQGGPSLAATLVEKEKNAMMLHCRMGDVAFDYDGKVSSCCYMLLCSSSTQAWGVLKFSPRNFWGTMDI